MHAAVDSHNQMTIVLVDRMPLAGRPAVRRSQTPKSSTDDSLVPREADRDRRRSVAGSAWIRYVRDVAA